MVGHFGGLGSWHGLALVKIGFYRSYRVIQYPAEKNAFPNGIVDLPC